MDPSKSIHNRPSNKRKIEVKRAPEASMRQNRPNYGRDSVCHLHCRSIVYGHVSKQWSERYCVGNCYKERDVPLFMCDKTGGCIGYGVFVGSQVIRLCSMHLLMFLFWRSYLRWLGVSRFDIVRNVADRFCRDLKTFLFWISMGYCHS